MAKFRVVYFKHATSHQVMKPEMVSGRGPFAGSLKSIYAAGGFRDWTRAKEGPGRTGALKFESRSVRINSSG
jgi:hypothetical protein